jgi:hypothetical protein
MNIRGFTKVIEHIGKVSLNRDIGVSRFERKDEKTKRTADKVASVRTRPKKRSRIIFE